MLIIPEIQIQDGKVITRMSVDGDEVVHDISPLEAVKRFSAAGAEALQFLDVDAAKGNSTNNEALIRSLIAETDVPVQVAGGIRTLTQINDWFEAGAARVVLGTVAITDTALVAEAAGRYPGGILVHLATRDGYAMIDGWKTQTAFRPGDIVLDLQSTGIAGVIHKGTENLDGDYAEAVALTEQISQLVSIPVYSSGTVNTLDDIARLRYIPNINGVIISYALMSGDIRLEDALEVAAQKEEVLQPESITPIAKHGIHTGIRAYMAAYYDSQAARHWTIRLRDRIGEVNPYMETMLPGVDIDVDVDNISARELQSIYEAEIDKADIVIAILDGVEAEAWTGFECGYARGKGKYIYGVTADQEEKTPSQLRFAAMCDEVITFTPSDDLSMVFDEISNALAARAMAQTIET